jgi:hypothetical protein
VTRQAFVTLLENIVAAEAKSSFPVAITFDDGNLSDAVIALPDGKPRQKRTIPKYPRDNTLRFMIRFPTAPVYNVSTEVCRWSACPFNDGRDTAIAKTETGGGGCGCSITNGCTCCGIATGNHYLSAAIWYVTKLPPG